MRSKKDYLNDITLKELETTKKIVSLLNDPLFLSEMELEEISELNHIKHSAFIIRLCLSSIEYDNINKLKK